MHCKGFWRVESVTCPATMFLRSSSVLLKSIRMPQAVAREAGCLGMQACLACTPGIKDCTDRLLCHAVFCIMSPDGSDLDGLSAPRTALRTSSAAGDPAADALAVTLEPRSLLTLLQAVLSPPSAASAAAPSARVAPPACRPCLLTPLAPLSRVFKT